ncbi:MAG: hypothetical protein CMK46_06960 [Porticoccus sp.]|uniref:phage minor head protein n=1 Tax=Pseudomonadota TaxID=1224 RepID=UPI000C5F35DA|nr:hypothetical protein [Rhodospirillaceae bacterium]MAY26192.1 hypothetical protein [Polycyclovorans sp.]MBG58013.1 hypothetical protein [Porticoccus sp.]QDP49882.1 MAG: putative minor head protein [Prokaryotic dsDNA virus sp.]MAX61619.1 hypothetical protein [Rhodospirillaceae bacterium]
MNKSARQLVAELERLEPTVARAYLAEVQRLVGAASIAEVESLISVGNIAGVITALQFSEADLSQLLESIRGVYVTGGTIEAGSLRPPRGLGRAAIRFDVRNTRAETWLRTESSRLVVDIAAGQRDGIRAAVARGTEIGRNPRQTALDIVGRISRQTGRRSGGIVGLSGPQAQYVVNARAQLLSGDPEQMRQYFERVRRDRRFDSIVQRAIDAGKPVKAADVDRIVGRYSDRLLALRGETIARTESLSAFNAARNEVYEQGIQEGLFRADSVLKEWSTSGDGRTRDTHIAMDGQRQKQGEPFRSPSGAMLMFPGDTSLGAGAAEVIQCRCMSQTRVDWIGEAT